MIGGRGLIQAKFGPIRALVADHKRLTASSFSVNVLSFAARTGFALSARMISKVVCCLICARTRHKLTVNSYSINLYFPLHKLICALDLMSS